MASVKDELQQEEGDELNSEVGSEDGWRDAEDGGEYIRAQPLKNEDIERLLRLSGYT